MGAADFYKHGDNNVICDVCGRKFKASHCKFKWNNMLACQVCFETRNPQDFVKGVKDDMLAKVNRPMATPIFVTWDTKPEDL
jgi:hypothetical protein